MRIVIIDDSLVPYSNVEPLHSEGHKAREAGDGEGYISRTKCSAEVIK